MVLDAPLSSNALDFPSFSALPMSGTMSQSSICFGISTSTVYVSSTIGVAIRGAVFMSRSHGYIIVAQEASFITHMPNFRLLYGVPA